MLLGLRICCCQLASYLLDTESKSDGHLISTPMAGWYHLILPIEKVTNELSHHPVVFTYMLLCSCMLPLQRMSGRSSCSLEQNHSRQLQCVLEESQAQVAKVEAEYSVQSLWGLQGRAIRYWFSHIY